MFFERTRSRLNSLEGLRILFKERSYICLHRRIVKSVARIPPKIKGVARTIFIRISAVLGEVHRGASSIAGLGSSTRSKTLLLAGDVRLPHAEQVSLLLLSLFRRQSVLCRHIALFLQ